MKYAHNEILLIDKPKGATSYDVIRVLKRELGTQKIGHSGTLDPNATGLLILGVEKGTKQLTAIHGLPKVYRARIFLGIRTDTGDVTGKVIEKQTVRNINKTLLLHIISELRGPLSLRVPRYSAVKVLGQKLYALARSGKVVPAPVREMKIFWSKLLDWHREENGYCVDIELKVKSGTYIRSIAEELGRRFGVPATLKELRRTRIGDFRIEDARQLTMFPRT